MPSQSATQLSAEWRREWEADNRPVHSCIQEAVPLIDEDKLLCGVCGADMTTFADGDDG